MTKQPKALRLADAIDSRDIVSESDVAAELRRLCQSEREGWRYADELEQERKRLHALNQELLEALQAILNISLMDNGHWAKNIEAEAHNAIAKATGGTNE